MLPRTHRVLGAELRRTMPQSRSYPADWGVIRYNQENTIACIACIVSKKIAKSSPNRHRIKRRMYAIIQPLLPKLKSGYYYLFPNKAVLTTPPDKLRAQVIASVEHFSK